MSFDAVLKDLKSKKYQPVYFLQGAEPYFIDQVSDYITSHVMDEAERDFNQVVLYGKEIEILDILNECKQFPMMAERRVVIVKEAQELSRTIAGLIDYIKSPTASTILVLCYKYKKLDGRGELSKVAKKSGYLFTADKVKEYKIPDWIIAEGKNQGLIIAPNAATLLFEYLGDDLNKIAKAFDKLKIALEGETTVDAKTIAKHIGKSREYGVFDLQKAIAKKDVMQSNIIALHFGNNPKNYPLVVSVSILYGYFSKLLKYHFLDGKIPQNELAKKVGVSPYFLKDYAAAKRLYPLGKLAKIISYLRDADLKSKGLGVSSVDNKEILKELVYKILH